jgi:hypothetical protein
VRVPHGHFDGGVPHQLLNDLEGYAPHRKVATVGVPQVVPSDDALWTADACHAQRPQQRVLEHPSGERLAVRLTEHVMNVKAASAIVCATDDDLANLNIALDARRFKPDIRVVIRLFDDDLVAKVRDTFKAEGRPGDAPGRVPGLPPAACLHGRGPAAHLVRQRDGLVGPHSDDGDGLTALSL